MKNAQDKLSIVPQNRVEELALRVACDMCSRPCSCLQTKPLRYTCYQCRETGIYLYNHLEAAYVYGHEDGYHAEKPQTNTGE